MVPIVVKSPLQMALLSPHNKALHIPVICREFIQDAFWAEHAKKKIDVYGFDWTPGRLDLNADNFKMLLKYNTPSQAEAARPTRALLNLWEKRLGYWTSDLRSTTDDTAKVLTFGKSWTEQPMRLSLLTLLLRVGSAYKTGESWPEFNKAAMFARTKELLHPADALTLSAAKQRIDVIWEVKEFPEQTYEQFFIYKASHENSGIVRYESN